MSKRKRRKPKVQDMVRRERHRRIVDNVTGEEHTSESLHNMLRKEGLELHTGSKVGKNLVDDPDGDRVWTQPLGGAGKSEGLANAFTLEDHMRKLPKWEGLYGFKPVWRDCYRQFNESAPIAETSETEAAGVDVYSGADIVSLQALGALINAHPIYVGTEQIMALPPLEDDPMQVIDDAALPFPIIFLDFCSARGPALLPVLLGDDRYMVEMYGAIIADSHPMVAESAESFTIPQDMTRVGWTASTIGGGRAIIPFGTGVVWKRNRIMGVDEEERVRHPAEADGTPMVAASTIGSVNTRTPPDVDRWKCAVSRVEVHNFPSPLWTGYVQMPYRGLKLVESPIENEVSWTPRDGDLGTFFGGPGMVVNQCLQYIKDGEDKREHESLREPEDLNDWNSQEESKMVALLAYGMAEYAARVLYLLDAANVDLSPAPVTRQIRRQAERTGTGIASVVTIRRTQVRRKSGESTGNKRNFTHRFERRWHYRHITRGPHYRLDYVKPCTRRDPTTGELTCPDGCRRELVKSTWVGDDSLPMKPKTRRLPPPPTKELES